MSIKLLATLTCNTVQYGRTGDLLAARTLSPCKAAFRPVVPQLVLLHGVAPPQLQDFASASVELHEISVSRFLQSNAP